MSATTRAHHDWSGDDEELYLDCESTKGATPDQQQPEECSRMLFFARCPPTLPQHELLQLFGKFGHITEFNLYRRWAKAKNSKGSSHEAQCTMPSHVVPMLASLMLDLPPAISGSVPGMQHANAPNNFMRHQCTWGDRDSAASLPQEVSLDLNPQAAQVLLGSLDFVKIRSGADVSVASTGKGLQLRLWGSAAQVESACGTLRLLLL
ncbi:hypothetical protein OEZ85_008888 [Tetradesmus obliquus]|uniref:RRM domain-containing protein n=1 Tax=Tetradesmus obliquus TaxID=3088 RepID=A0ABY8TM70_TETOB|nr:hypothetical protein OEZ85_008888 [Tetradesmus obliquus]